MKRLISAAILSLLALSSSCERRGTSAQRIATPTPSPLWLDARISRSRDGFYSEDFVLLDHRFSTASGERSSYDAGWIRLAVTPRANGDHTITIAARLTEKADTNNPTNTESGSVTVTDGRATTHQVGGIRFTFTATTDPQLLKSADSTKPATTFTEGTYILPPRFGDSYTFTRGVFIRHPSTGAAVPDGMPPPQRGRYHIEGERIAVSFDGTEARTLTFQHRIVDGIHILVDDKDLYILSPPDSEDFWAWWRAMPSTRPDFAKLFPDGTF